MGSFGDKVGALDDSIASTEQNEMKFPNLETKFKPLFKGDVLEMQGQLMKLGKKHKKETFRYYVLKQNTLIMFPSEKIRNPRRVYFLKGTYVDPIGNNGIRIYHEHPQFATLELFAETELLRDEWLGHLTKAAGYEKFEDKYEKLDRLGRGKFSLVFKARNKRNG